MRFDEAVALYLEDLETQRPGTARAWSSPLRRAARPARKRYGAPAHGYYTDSGDLRRAKARQDKPYPGLGGKQLDRITNADLHRVIAAIGSEARTRVNGVRGKGAEENARTALRSFYRWARVNGLTTATPDEGLPNAKRGRIPRRAYTVRELQQVQEVLDRSRDPELARVFLRLALETGGRHAELLAITFNDLSETDGTVALIKKGFKGRYLNQPLTASLFKALISMMDTRTGGRVTNRTPVLISKQGEPLTRRYFERLSETVRVEIPDLGRGSKSWFTTHGLRHTAATLVERTAGESVARLFLGHAPSSRTQEYVSADIDELRAALVLIWGEPLAGEGHGYGVGEPNSTLLLARMRAQQARAESSDWALEQSDDALTREPDPMDFYVAEVSTAEAREAEERLLRKLSPAPRKNK